MNITKINSRGADAAIVLPMLVVLFFSVSALLSSIIVSSRKTTTYFYKQRARGRMDEKKAHRLRDDNDGILTGVLAELFD